VGASQILARAPGRCRNSQARTPALRIAAVSAASSEGVFAPDSEIEMRPSEVLVIFSWSGGKDDAIITADAGRSNIQQRKNLLCPGVSLLKFAMKRFTPSKVPFQFTEQHDSGVIGTRGRYRGQPVPYGSASFVVPRSVPNDKRIAHIVQTIEPLLDNIRAAGATKWHISIGRFYYAQCNEEYSLEELQLISRLGCGFIYSAYNVTEEEEKELERKYEDFRH
jgi:hypothetical protein